MELLIRLKKKQYMSAMRTCLIKFNYWKKHPWCSRWRNCAKKAVTRMNGNQVSQHVSSSMGETRLCNRQTHPFGCPRRASNRTPDQSSGRPEANSSCGRPQAKCRNNIARMASTIHGMMDEEIFKFDRRFSSGRGHPTSSNSSFSASSSKTYFKRIWRKAQFVHSLSQTKTRIAKSADPRQLQGRDAEGFLTVGRTELRLPKDVEDMISVDHKILKEDQESRLHHRKAVVLQDLATQWIHSYPCTTKSIQETQKHVSCTTSVRRNFVSIGSVWTASKLVGRSRGVWLLSPKSARLTRWWREALRMAVQFTIRWADYFHWSRSKMLSSIIKRQKTAVIQHKTGGDLMRESQQHSSVEREEARDPDQMLKLDKMSWALWDIAYIGIMLLRERSSMFRRTLFRYFWVTLMSRDKRSRALMYFMRLPSVIIGILMERSHLSEPSIGVTRFALLNKEGQMWIQGRLTKNQVSTRPEYIWPEEWPCRKNQRKALDGQKKEPQLDAARERAIFFTPKDFPEFEEIIPTTRGEVSKSEPQRCLAT